MTASNFNLKAAHNYLSAASLQAAHKATLEEAHVSLNRLVERLQKQLTHFQQTTFFRKQGFEQRFPEHSKAIERTMQSVRRRQSYLDRLIASTDIGRHYVKTSTGSKLEGAWQALLAADPVALAEYLPYNAKALGSDEAQFFAELITSPCLKKITHQWAGGREAHSSWAFAFDLNEAQVAGVKLAFDLTYMADGTSQSKTTISIFSGVIHADGKLTIDKEITDGPQAMATAMRAIARIVAQQHGGTVTGPLI